MSYFNVDFDVADNKLKIEVDLTKVQGLSKSEKSEIIGTTSGNLKIPDTDIWFGVNVYRKLPEKEGKAGKEPKVEKGMEF